MNLRNFFFVLITWITFGSCKKDIDKYEDDPMVYFYVQQANSTVLVSSIAYSFATRSVTLAQDTIYVGVKIIGLAAPTERKFGAEAIIDANSATAGTDYKILTGTVKANQLMGRLPVVVYRTADLKTITKQLKIRLKDENDFKAGVIESNLFTLNWNDALIKPTNWDSVVGGLLGYFGTYSRVKYQFIIDTIALSAFPVQGSSAYSPTLITNQQMLEYARQLKLALAQYNSTHTTPLTDEFGVAVTFP
ncbi:DUF4843 domain-containing protein [Pedobacter frigidisoli]|nr:DUF4843 domain-containing protein [Pedobacter frigidisoli]